MRSCLWETYRILRDDTEGEYVTDRGKWPGAENSDGCYTGELTGSEFFGGEKGASSGGGIWLAVSQEGGSRELEEAARVWENRLSCTAQPGGTVRVHAMPMMGTTGTAKAGVDHTDS